MLTVPVIKAHASVSVVAPKVPISEDVMYNEMCGGRLESSDVTDAWSERIQWYSDYGVAEVDSMLTMEPLGVPATEWSKYYGGADADDAWSVVQTADGGYLVVGDTVSYGSGIYDFWIVKTDSSGNQEWAKTYGGSASDRARSVARTFDGGYIVAGYTDPPGSDPADVWIVKIDAMGTKQWDLQWGGSNRDMAYSVIQSSDGRYIVAGYTMSFGAGSEDAFLLKIDPVLGTSYVVYGGPNSDIARCAVQTCDGGFAIAGYTKSYGSGSYDFWLIKTDYAGNMLWQKTHGNTGSDMAYSIVQTSEGGYILAGDTDYYTAGSCDFWVVKTNSVGNLAWSQKFGGTGFDSASSVVQTCDGGYLIAGETASFGAVLEDFWVVKTDSEGFEQWNQRYGGSGSDRAYSALQASDGGYAIAGPTSSFGAGSTDFWLVKLGNEWPMADLRILPRLQLKDTRMLCLDGCSLSGVHGWDVPHRAENWQQCPHDNMYCTRASISMINSYYGGRLSQDRISYYYFEQLHRDGKPGPEGDLGHNIGMPADEALSWALNGAVGDHYSGKPDFSLIKQWIDTGQPILRFNASGVGHFTVIDGYAIIGSDNRVHLLDPWYGNQSFVSYSTLHIDETWRTPAGATARSDEDWNNNGKPDTMEDYDNDGVCDFDEIYRFLTRKDQSDTDSDGVPDKAEIISYTFLSDGSFDASDIRKPDPDNDGLRTEKDLDSDNGGVRDGLEDKNGNGFVDVGETDPLNPSDDPNPIHLESRQDNSASFNLGTIKFDVSTYSLPNDITKPAGTYQIEYNAASGYKFDHWEIADGISVANPNAWSTTATVTGAGTLKAIYKAVFAVHLESRQDNSVSSNLGAITFDGTSYNLPNDVSKPVGDYQAQYYPMSGYIFDHWETTGEVSVSNAYSNPATVTVSSAGTLRAIYKIVTYTPVHNLNTGLNYTTIQAALDAPETLNGHTVFVENGTYHENVIVRKSITLMGQDKSATIIDGDGSTVINVQSNNVKITGFTIQNGWSGILVDGFNGTEITDNIISFNVGTGIGDGIYIVRSHTNTIHNNTISHNTEDGLTLAPNTTDNTISGNNIFLNGGSGVYMHDFADRNTIVGNNISSNDANGLYMANVFANLIAQNSIELNEDGIELWSSSNNTISGNNIAHNSQQGIVLYSSSNNNSISGNSVVNNGYGVCLHPSTSNNIITGNSIMANYDHGLWLSYSSDNYIIGNFITATIGDGIELGSSNNNKISGNNITSNTGNGILIAWSSYNNNVWDNNIEANNGTGIIIYSSSNDNIVTMNIVMASKAYGIWLYYSSNNSISGNNVTANNWDGIYLGYSSNYNSISGNNVTANNEYGILLLSSSNYNSISGNNIANNYHGIRLGYSSNYNSISGNNVTANNEYGIYLDSSSNNSISGNNITNNEYGIYLGYSSNYNSISGNNITNNEYGIYLGQSSNNSISGNNVTANNKYGIWLHSSSNNSISGNNIANNDGGIRLSSSSNTIAGNNITANNEFGISLYASSSNTIAGNIITNNGYGIRLDYSSSNTIYHNNFMDNTNQVYSSGSINIWDDGYPSGGNYWSDYTSLDFCYGPYQNETGRDGIGDAPYIIDANNRDNYPLINIWNPPANVLFFDDFEDGDLDGWTMVNGNWIVADQELTQSDSSHWPVIIWAGDKAWINYVLQVRVKPTGGSGHVFVLFRFVNNQNFYLFGIRENWDDVVWNKCVNGSWGQEISQHKIIEQNQWYTLSIVVHGTSIRGYVDNVLYIETSDADLPNGAIALDTHVASACFDDVIARSLFEIIEVPMKDGEKATIESNVTITNAIVTKSTLHFDASGPSGFVGWINVTFPMVNTTEIKVFINEVKLTPPPFPIITTNGTHYFIYFEITLSTHNISIQYAIADIATTNITLTKTIVGQGYTIRVNVTIQNQGDYEETFNVTIYANTTEIGKQTITLANETSATISFLWNTSGFVKGNYTIWAYASPIPGETDTLDNTRIADSEVKIGVPGDLNNDNKCNLLDLVKEAGKFGAEKGDPHSPPAPKYDPNYDFNDDNKINLLDLVIVARHFGTTDP
jgi:parallel beta-helix repeat protein